MAVDWIRMRTDLYRDPKVCVMAECLMAGDGDLARYTSQISMRNMTVTRNVMRNAVIGALLSVWGVMRHRGKRDGADLVCGGISIHVIDDIADLPGFGDAMLSVGWVDQTDDGIVFHRFFEEYNSEPSAAAASKGADRQRRYRERKKAECDAKRDATGDVTSDVTVTPREEKRREEINTDSAIAESKARDKKTDLPDWVPRSEWSAYVEMRKRLKKPMTAKAAELAIAKLAEMAKQGHSPAAVLNQSTFNSWQGLFPIKQEGGNATGQAHSNRARSVVERVDHDGREWLRQRGCTHDDNGQPLYDSRGNPI